MRFLFLLTIFLTNICFGHVVLQGKICVKNESYTHLDAIISIAEKNYKTDSLGRFFIELDSLPHEITISSEGFITKHIHLHEVPEFLVVYLEEAPINYLNNVEIFQSRNWLKTITKIDLSNRCISSGQDLLRIVPGLFTAQHAGGGKAEQMFLRGFDLDHGTDIAINVDGAPTNMVSHAHGQGYADLHYVIPETVSNIDYQKGAYAAEQGNLATAGSVTLNTYDQLTESKIIVEGVQFQTFRNANLINLLPKTENNKSAYVASEVLMSNGPFKLKQDFKRINLFAKYVQNYKNSKLEFSLHYFQSSWKSSNQIPLRLINAGFSRFGTVDSSEGGLTSRKGGQLQYTYNMDPNNLIKFNTYLFNYDFDLYSNFTFYKNDTVNGDGIRQFENRNVLGLNLMYTNTININSKIIKTSFGVQARNDHVTENGLEHVVRRKYLNTISRGNIDESNFSAFTKIDFQSKKLKIEAALRGEVFSWAYTGKVDTLTGYFDKQQQIVLPRLKLTYLGTKNKDLFLNMGRGFHSNDARTLTNFGHKGMLPYTYGADFGAHLPLSANWFLMPIVWVLYSEQEFVYVGDEGVIEAGGKSFRKGVELTLRGKIQNKIQLDADFTYSVPRYVGVMDDEKYIPLAPVLTGTGGFDYKINSKFNFGARLRYMGDRPANESNTIIAKGYCVIDFSSTYSWAQHSIGLNIQNITNQKWYETQFLTNTRLKNEAQAVDDLHVISGTPLFAKVKYSYAF
ncbi:MAG: TonB-dependent receptor plug domain-containing protein [Cytophagales bacterium]